MRQYTLQKGSVSSHDLLRLSGVVLLLVLVALPIYFSDQNHGNAYIISVAQGSSSKQVVVVQLYEQIDQGSASMISRGISEAETVGAQAVIIDMNTPGGLLSDMITMIDAINSTKIPVYTFVGNDSSAASAGSYVAMATDKIFMGAGSVIGPSTPFIIGGAPGEQQHVSDFAFSLMQSLAVAHGRNATAAGIMVSNNTAYNDGDAIRLHVVDGYSPSLSATIAILSLSGDTVLTVSENLSEQAVSFLSNSTVDGILLLLGIIAIVLDFLHPTIILSIAGAVLIVLALIGAEAIQGLSPTLVLPLVLFAVAAALIVLELKTGHGFMLFSGVIVGVFATLLLSFNIPYSPSPFGNTQYGELAILIVIGAFFAIYARWVGNTLRKKPLTGSESLIGREGRVYSDLNPDGEVTVDGIVWRASLVNPDLGTISKGRTVIVKGLSGLSLLVEPQGIKEKQTDSKQK